MKSFHIIRSFALAMLLSLPAFAANQPESTSSQAQTQNPPATSPAVAAAQKNYKDAFLAFALDKAEKYSGAAEQAVSKAVDAATKEAPVLAHEFIVWRAWMHALKGFSPVLACAIFLALFCRYWPKFELDQQGNLKSGTTGSVATTVISGIASVILFLIICFAGFSNILDFVQVIVAPRVYVVEQVLQLFRQ